MSRIPTWLMSYAPGGGGGGFDPTSLVASLYVRGPFSASPWVGVASAGSSGGRNLTEGTNPPSVGTTQNGIAPANFDGTNDQLSSALTMGDIFAADGSEGEIWALYRSTTAAAASAGYDDAPILVDSGGNIDFNFTASGFGLYMNGTNQNVAATNAAYHVARVRWDSTIQGITIDSASEATVANVTACPTSGTLVVGVGPYGGLLAGRLMELMTFRVVQADADFTAYKDDYIATTYALTL